MISFQNHYQLMHQFTGVKGFVLILLVIIQMCCVYPVFAGEPAPEVNSISPDTGYAGFSYPVILEGDNYVPNCTAGLTLEDSELPISNLTAESSSILSFRVNIPVDAKPGLYQLHLISPSGEVQKINQAFHVQPPAAPEVENLSPREGMAGSPVHLSMTGRYFRSGGSVSLVKGDQVINLTNLSVSYGLIEGTSILPVNALPGDWKVCVINSDGQSGNFSGLFRVIALPPPNILSISPDQGDMDTKVLVAVTGSNFVPGATFSLSRKDKTIPGMEVVVDSSGRITGSVSVPAKFLEGLWDLTVVNPDGQSAQKSNAFLSGTPSAPFSLQISPSWGVQGTSRQITIRGMGFLEGDTVTLQRAERTIPATNISIVSDTQITCTIPLPADIQPGGWDVVVTSRYHTSDILKSGFTIYDKTSLILAGMEPSSGEQGQVLSASVSGHNLENGSTISLTAPGEDPIKGEVNSVLPSEIQILIHIPSDAMPDDWDLTLTPPSGKPLTKEHAFRVSYNKTPVITAIDPDRAKVGAHDLKVTMTGTNFGDGEYLDVNLSLNGTVVPVSGVVSYKGTRAIGYLTIPNGTPAGWYDLSVTRDAGLGKRADKTEMFRIL